jgi:formylglycine-generating enzyme required for sulfatase activity
MDWRDNGVVKTKWMMPVVVLIISACSLAPALRIVPKDGMIQVHVPAGPFSMGAGQDEVQALEAEKPQHLVTLREFWIDRTEVTLGMFAKFLKERGNQTEAGMPWFNPDVENAHIHFTGKSWKVDRGYLNHPVVAVSWYGARAYCTWAGRRLPTEAEWEKAARGTDGREYPWGEDVDCNLANLRQCTGDTRPVGSYPRAASPYGALDMAGNAAEWVADWYGSEYYRVSPLNDPAGAVSGEQRVVRGGSWGSSSWFLRTDYRGYERPTLRGGSIGFRCVYSLHPPPEPIDLPLVLK